MIANIRALVGISAALLVSVAPQAMAQVSPLPVAGPAKPEPPAQPRGDGDPVAPPPSKDAAPEGAVGGLGDINLYPKRVVIDDRNRVSSVGIYNKTANTGDYEIAITDMIMQPDGRLIEAGAAKDDDPGKARLKGAATLIRFSPHRFTLQGNELQLVRIQARVSADLPAGEYRTHFASIAVPPGEDAQSIEAARAGQQAPNGIGVRITPRFGISIPVIIRVGETTLTAGLKDLSVITTKDGHHQIRLSVTRSGTRSAFGDITITAPGASKPVAVVRGVGVYPEVDSRTVLIPVDDKTDPRLVASGARLTVTYVDDDYAPGQTLARQDFQVP